MKLKVDHIAENLMALHPLLYKSISKPLRNLSSITPGGMFVMASLKRCGTLSMSDIGKCLSMPKPHITVIVDKLIDEGYAVRQNDLRDRRIINITLTDKGLLNYDKIRQEVSETLKTKLILLTEQELEQLADASKVVKEILVSLLSIE